MSCCNDCSGVAIAPLVGAESWRASRVVGATGPTGPAGVIDDLRSPTGPVAAILEGEWCGDGPLSLSGRIAGSGNATGVLTVWSRCDNSLSRGAWLSFERASNVTWPTGPIYAPTESEVEPTQLNTQPTLSNPISRSPFYFATTGAITGSDGPPPAQQPGKTFRSSRTPNNLVFDPEQWPNTFRATGPTITFEPMRIKAGHAASGLKTTVADLYSIDDSFRPLLFATSDQLPFRIGVAVNPIGSATGTNNAARVSRAGIEVDQWSLGFDVPHAAVTGPTSDFHFGVDIAGQRATGQTMIGLDARTYIVSDLHDGRSVSIPKESVGIQTSGPTFLGTFTPATGPTAYRPDLFPSFTTSVGGTGHCMLTDGPSWHEQNLVLGGGTLAEDGARHRLSVTFSATGSEADETTEWGYGFQDWPFGGAFPVNRSRGIGMVLKGESFDRRVFMASISGEEFVLDPNIGERKLFPGQYAGFRDDIPAKEYTEPAIENFVIDPNLPPNSPLVPVYYDNDFNVAPVVSVFATTQRIREGFLNNIGYTDYSAPHLPAGVSFESSGMCIDNFDKYRSDSLGGLSGSGFDRVAIETTVVFEFHWYAKIEVTKIRTFTGSRVRYIGPFVAYAYTRLTLPKLLALSNGEEVSASFRWLDGQYPDFPAEPSDYNVTLSLAKL